MTNLLCEENSRKKVARTLKCSLKTIARKRLPTRGGNAAPEWPYVKHSQRVKCFVVSGEENCGSMVFSSGYLFLFVFYDDDGLITESYTSFCPDAEGSVFHPLSPSPDDGLHFDFCRIVSVSRLCGQACVEEFLELNAVKIHCCVYNKVIPGESNG